MTTIKHCAFAFAVTLCALMVSGQAQTPRVSTINISAQTDKVHITAEGDVSEMRVEVSDEQGEVVFQSGAISGQQLDWNMTDAQGERVAAGTYLFTVTFRTAAGKLRKRVEQVTVDEAEKSDQPPTAAPQAVQAAITGAGTANKIAKFTGVATIGNSIITESATKRIGINNTAPTATLQVNAAQPPPLAGNGTSAAPLLQTNGGKGGNTTGAAAGFQNAGAGASISLQAGDGGDAPEGSRRGPGGSITLQPGSTGTGAGLAGVSGNVLIDPSGVGNVGIGTLSPTSKLTVRTETSNYGLVHTDGTVTVGSFVSVVGGWYGTKSNHPLSFFTNDSGAAMKIATSGRVSIGTTNESLAKLYVYSGNNYGVFGESNTGDAVSGRSSTGYAGYFYGKVKVTGNLFVDGAINPSSDRNLKANFTAVNPRLILDKLVAIPVQTWNYKSDSETVRHIGVMAQDFRSAFNLGIDDKHISTVDADGVALAAIQGLYQMMQEKNRQIEQQIRRNEQQSRQITELQARLSNIERTTRQRRANRRRTAR